MLNFLIMSAIKIFSQEKNRRAVVEGAETLIKDTKKAVADMQKEAELLEAQKKSVPKEFKAFCKRHDSADTWDQVSLRELSSFPDRIITPDEKAPLKKKIAQAMFKKRKYKELINFSREAGTLSDLTGQGLIFKAYLAISLPDQALRIYTQYGPDKIGPATLYEWAIFAEEAGQPRVAIQIYEGMFSLNLLYKDTDVRYKALKGQLDQLQAKIGVVPPLKERIIVSNQNNNLQQTDSVSSDIATLRESAYQASKDGDRDRAIGICNKILKSNPEDAKTLSLRGVVYSALGEYDNAQLDFTQAIRINPEESDAFEGQAFLYCAQGELDQAMLNVNKAIRINPDDGDYYFLRGMVYFKKDNYEKAISDFNAALELDIKDDVKGPLYVLRGNAFLRQEENEKARSDFDNAIRINPNNGEAYTNRAVLHMNQDEDAKAQDDFDKALEVDPENTEALELRAMVYRKLGEIDKAKEDLDKAILLNPDNVDELIESRAELDQ